MRILKQGGYCSEGCQWFFCDFYETVPIKESVTDDSEVITGYKHKCNMFNGLELHRGSLVICNKIYGLTYEGNP